MNGNLVSFNKLKNDINLYSAMGIILRKESRKELKELKNQINELEKTLSNYISLFSDRGWCVYDSMNFEMAKKAVFTAEEQGIEAGEKVILDYYKDDVKLIKHWLWNKAAPFSIRYQLLSNAFDEHFEGRYYASVPLFLIIIDGVVNDFTKSKGFFAEGTDVSAWDCLVGCDESLSKMKGIFNQNRTNTNTEEIFIPYRNGILHGRDVNYGNEYVSCKCIALMFAIADWIQMSNSTDSRKAKFEKENNPPSILESLARIRQNNEDRKKIDSWKKRKINVGEDISSNPTDEECEEYPYVKPVREAFKAWSKKNYGKLSEAFSTLFSYENSARKRAGECREIFAEKELVSYKLLEVEERGVSMSRILVEATWTTDEKQITKNIEFGVIYQSEGGNIAFPWNGDGVWKLRIWNAPVLYS